VRAHVVDARIDRARIAVVAVVVVVAMDATIAVASVSTLAVGEDSITISVVLARISALRLWLVMILSVRRRRWWRWWRRRRRSAVVTDTVALSVALTRPEEAEETSVATRARGNRSEATHARVALVDRARVVIVAVGVVVDVRAQTAHTLERTRVPKRRITLYVAGARRCDGRFK
jgi:hypothetical protein